MLINSFFDIIKITQNQQEGVTTAPSDSYTIQIRLHPDHKIFGGHFPGNPVVPGVCQLRMVTEIVSEITGKNIKLLEADTIKFLSMINPNEHPKLTIDCLLKYGEEGKIHVTASISDHDQIFFKYKSVVV